MLRRRHVGLPGRNVGKASATCRLSTLAAWMLGAFLMLMISGNVCFLLNLEKSSPNMKSSNAFFSQFYETESRDDVLVLNPEVCALRSRNITISNNTATPSLAKPNGLVITLLLGGENPQLRNGLCNLFPSQLTHFIVPHELDVLLVVSGNLDVADIIKCLGLTSSPASQDLSQGKVHRRRSASSIPPETNLWNNLDGSTMTTKTYYASTVIAGTPFVTRVFVSHRPLASKENTGSSGQDVLEFPKYIAQNWSLLETPIEPPMCRAPVEYIQGTRWYTNEMLHLKILENYEYFLKLDPDLVFTRPLPFSILEDMRRKGAFLGHAGEYPEGVPTPCAEGLSEAVQAYINASLRSTDSTRVRRRNICAVPKSVKNADRYYSNFLIGRVDIFQSAQLLDFARWLSEYPRGFFHRRWTDQIFWHVALQLTTGLSEVHSIADYTNFRCFPHRSCWMSSLDLKNYPDVDICANGGVFIHTKHASKWVHRWDRHLARHKTYSQESNWNSMIPYQSTYREDCEGTRWKRKVP